MKFFPDFKDDGKVAAGFGDARLIRFLDGKLELRGGSKDDRAAAREWMSMFWHEAVVHDE
jgi:hypothetical protein